ncbi:MAG TPA: glutathione peroxidase [Bacteroidales bacterium]|nr:glutathione peroxidase [Bacteroidales bacterium]
MKRVLILISATMVLSLNGFTQKQSFYDFKVKTLEGETFDFATLKGKKVMIVNTASKCGYTPQYKELEELWDQYGGKNFVIIGFPANNFANQEPGSAEEIREFCTKNYGVSFPMMEKISVKGSDIHPVYQWLTQKSRNGVMDSDVKWNFQKYLIDENGNLAEVLPSKEKPNSDKVISWLAVK